MADLGAGGTAASAHPHRAHRRGRPCGETHRRRGTTVNHSATTTTRRLRVSHRWLRTYEIHTEQAHTGNTGIEWGLASLAKLKIATEIAVKQQYSISDLTEQTFAEEIEITIPGHTVTEVTLHWKRVWQEGYAEVSDGAAPPVAVPFRLVIGITFDQKSRDL